MNSKFLISVIVPVFNGEKFLIPCLEAIFASDYPKIEVILVDDGSTDDSANIGRLKGATVISSERRQSGPATARNLAAMQARGEIFLFVDADVVIKKDTISKIAGVFENQPDCSALFGSYDTAPAEPNFLSQYRNLLHHFVHQNSCQEASTFWAGLGAIRKDVFIQIGGFDCEKFQVPSIEDIELGTRLRSAGHRILLVPEIQAKHMKKWSAVSIIRTDIFCRALPWSKLILTNKELINDMNLKTSDRLSAGLVGLCIIFIPFAFWQPIFLLVILLGLISIIYLNRKILLFFVELKGFLFAALTFPWLFFYFFYSAATFGFCWFRYALPQLFEFGKTRTASQIEPIGEFKDRT